MAKRKKPVQDAGTERDDSIRASVLQKAQKYLPPEKVSEMLETQDLIHLMLRDTITQDLAQAGIVYSPLEHLEELTRLFLRHWEDNREHLIKTGHPLTYLRLGIWFPFYSHKLYPTKSVKWDWVRLSNFLRQLVGRGSQSVSGENNEGPDKLPTKEVSFSYEWINQDGICEYDKASIMDNIDPNEAAFLEASRAALFELRIQILKLLLEAVQKRSSIDLWNNCVSLLTDTITHQDAAFFLNMDEIFRESIKLIPPIGADIYTAGGLDDLLTIIGRYELELNSGDMTKVYTILQKLWEYQQRKGLQVRIPDYFEAYGQPLQSILDGAADMYLATSRDSSAFWQEYDQRVNEALENEFYEEIIIQKKVKRKLVSKYKPQVNMFADGTIAWLERTGTIPDLIMTQPEPAPRKEENALICEGDYWAITYKGETSMVKRINGMLYIARLLDNPEREFNSLDLEELVNPRASGESDFSRSQTRAFYSTKDDDEIDEKEKGRYDGLRISQGIDELGTESQSLDTKAIAQIKQHYKELQAELSEAETINDLGQIENLKTEIEFIKNELSSSLSLGGRARTTPTSADRVRVKITKAIKRAIGRISENNASLGSYLNNTIRSGYSFSYVPDPNNPVRFKVQF